MLHRILFSLALLAAPLVADETNKPAAKVESRSIVIRPAREPATGTFQLVFDLQSQRSGNAAIDVYKAMLLAQQANLDLDKQPEPKDVTEDKRAAIVKSARDVYRYLEYAARCRTCDWQIPWNDEPPFSIVLPELAKLRGLQRLLMLRAQLELSRGEIAAAVETLRIGYALARHTATGPTLIHGLVGVSMGAMVNQQLEQVIQHKDCPCLYWSLMALPRPFVDLKPALSFEATAIELQFPFIKRLRDEKLDVNSSTQLVTDMLRELVPLVQMGEGKAGDSTFEITTMLAMLAVFTEAPAAKKRLQAEGYEQERLDRMPLPQLAVLDSYHRYRQQYSAMLQWFDLPLDEAVRREAEFKQRWTHESDKSLANLFQMLIPAVSQARKSAARVDRQFAALLTIEALRRHVDLHGTKLPETLAEVKDSVLPRDSMTGEWLKYARQGDGATLIVPHVGDAPQSTSTTWQYELQLAR